MQRTSKNLVATLILTLVVVLGAASFTAAQNLGLENSKGKPEQQESNNPGQDRFRFPVTPGTKEWRELQSHGEMLKATQIPRNELVRLGTSALLETVLDYPLLMDMLAYNSPQAGFNALLENFNGLSELHSRRDVGRAALIRYRSSDAERKESLPLEKQGEISFQLSFLEVLLAQDTVRDTLGTSETDQLLDELVAKSKLKQDQFDLYGYQGLESTAFAIGKLLNKKDKDFAVQVSQDFDLQQFLAEGSASSARTVNQILERSNAGTVLREPLSIFAADYYSTVSTPQGTLVPVVVGGYELTSAQIASANAYVADNYPLAVRETDASRKYNCHSYAWHDQSTSNNKWMGSPGDDTYWNDGSYLSTTSGVANRRVSYPASKDHSAIVYNSTTFRSKWGQLPRMRHAYSYCPYWSSGITLKYYSSYDFSPSPQTIVITRGATPYWDMYTSTSSGFRGTVSYYAIGLPGNQVLPGTGFSPQSVSIQADNVWYLSRLKIYTNSQTPRGNFAIRIEGRSGGKTVVRYIYLNII
ncbi:MAG: hypothetical protein QOD75_126 [Blastocatellia bacterium]|nr:hypothetical protein [Blastocatellia bacterium]